MEIHCNDPLGDTINFSQLMIYDKTNGTNHTQTIVNSLSKMTGLTLSVDDYVLKTHSEFYFDDFEEVYLNRSHTRVALSTLSEGESYDTRMVQEITVFDNDLLVI